MRKQGTDNSLLGSDNSTHLNRSANQMLTTARGMNENSELFIEDIDAQVPSKSKFRQKLDSKLLIPPLNVGKIKTRKLDDYVASSDDDQDADITSNRSIR